MGTWRRKKKDDDDATVNKKKIEFCFFEFIRKPRYAIRI